MVQSQPRQIVLEILSKKKSHHKKELVECVKVQALNSSPRTAKKKKKVGFRPSNLIPRGSIVVNKNKFTRNRWKGWRWERAKQC
jgi:hypothetical protein